MLWYQIETYLATRDYQRRYGCLTTVPTSRLPIQSSLEKQDSITACSHCSTKSPSYLNVVRFMTPLISFSLSPVLPSYPTIQNSAFHNLSLEFLSFLDRTHLRIFELVSTCSYRPKRKKLATLHSQLHAMNYQASS